jgi:hypothetical protein
MLERVEPPPNGVAEIDQAVQLVRLLAGGHVENAEEAVFPRVRGDHVFAVGREHHAENVRLGPLQPAGDLAARRIDEQDDAAAADRRQGDRAHGLLGIGDLVQPFAGGRIPEEQVAAIVGGGQHRGIG